ncbi:MAG: hypothetical protein CL568_03115 [Alphaproteobacteria bacterium]|jgi:hypothetical protein|nr:hypothetical protein [Alphaproteobacteria bacterium]PPR14610.1 MAG: hypothetical protein CFH42_00369 [Alphaproteobacteria bacterium MarineAlpha12_Bin1]|tara:strand:- start:168 stop:410 length:243 start_codon:yes stop_codon:yes gene_type:complete
MSTVEKANQRLSEALSRLESGIGSQEKPSERDLAFEAEKLKLEEEVSSVKKEFANMRKTSLEVSLGLEKAIAKMKNILAK